MTLKNSFVTGATTLRVGSDPPATDTGYAVYFAMPLSVRFRSRKSSKFGSASRENVPRWLTSQTATSRSGCGYGNGRSRTP